MPLRLSYYSSLNPWGRIVSAYLAICGASVHTPFHRVRGHIIVRLGLLLSLALPTLSFLTVACDHPAELSFIIASNPLSPLRLHVLTPSSDGGQPELRHAAVFLYDSASGGLDSFQQWTADAGEGPPVLLSLSSSLGPRTVAVVANLPGKSWEWAEFSYLGALSSLPRCSLSDERPEAPVMSGLAETEGAGSDEDCTVTLMPLLCRVRLRSLRCDFSERSFPPGTSLSNVRCYLVNAPSESTLFPGPGTAPPGYLNIGSDCDSAALPCPELLSAGLEAGAVGAETVYPDLSLYCYPNPSETDGPGTPLTRLVIQGDMLGRTWYYPVNLPPMERGKSYDFHITLTQTGASDPDTPVDRVCAAVSLTVCPWEAYGDTQTIPFRKTQLRLTYPFSSAPSSGDDRITDVNLLVYTEDGILQERRFYSARTLPAALAEGINVDLLSPLHYTIIACANLGYALGAEETATLERLSQARYYLSYPDEYSQGFPMVGALDFEAGSADEAEIPLKRLMARITVHVDRSRLNEDLRFDIRSIGIGNCPRSAKLLPDSRAETERDLFVNGFYLDGTDVDPLNLRSRTGLSDPVQLYLLENVQGELLNGPLDQQGKVLPPGAPEANVCSFVELHIDYQSSDWYSSPDHYLIYRFYLGEGPKDFSVRRGGDYRFVVTPEKNGLGDGSSSWRIDRSLLGARAPYFELHPAAYNECSSSDSFHIWCEVTPSTTPMYIEPLAWDDDERVEDLYSYDLDPDGFGITIHPRKGGTALVYFSAGPPVSRDTLALLRIDP